MPRFTLIRTPAEDLHEQISEDISFTEHLAGNGYVGCRGTYSADHWPSSIEVHKHPEQGIYRLSAAFDLPYGVRGSYLSLDQMHKAVSSKLSPAALKGFTFKHCNTDVELFPKGTIQKAVQSPTAGTVNTYDSGPLHVVEHWSSHTVTIEVSGENLPSTVHITKDRGGSLYSVTAAFELPDSLRGQFSNVDQVLSLLTKEYWK